MADFFRRCGTKCYPNGGLSAELYACVDYAYLKLLRLWVYLDIRETLELPIA